MKKVKGLCSLLLSVALIAGFTSCSSTDDKKGAEDESQAVEDVVNDYMSCITSGKYEKASKLTNEDEFNINIMYNSLSEDQMELVNCLISTTEYKISGVKVEDDKGSCKVELTTKDYMSAYYDLGNKWELVDYTDAIKDTDDTTSYKIKLSLIKDDDKWVIKSDSSVSEYYYNMVEGFVVPELKLTADGIEDYIEDYFTSGDLAYNCINSSEAYDSLIYIFLPEEQSAEFLNKYLNYVYYDVYDITIDEEAGTATATVEAEVPRITDIISYINTDHSLFVSCRAYQYGGDEFWESHQDDIYDLYYNSYLASLSYCGYETVTRTVTFVLNENGDYEASNNLGETMMSPINYDDIQYISDEEYKNCSIEGLDIAYENGWVDYDTYTIYHEELVPTHATELTIYVEYGYLFVDDVIFGMSFDEANAFFGGDFPETTAWEWEGGYDSYFDYEFNGNNYTFFFSNNKLAAVRYEVVANYIDENIIMGYESIYGQGYALTTSYGDYIPEPEHNSGYRFYAGSYYVDVFNNIYDDTHHVAIHYSVY